jgi:hypothetical protein
VIKNYKVKQNKIFNKSQKKRNLKIKKEIKNPGLIENQQEITKGKNWKKNKKKREKKLEKQKLENENSNTKFTINLTVIPSKGT